MGYWIYRKAGPTGHWDLWGNKGEQDRQDSRICRAWESLGQWIYGAAAPAAAAGVVAVLLRRVPPVLPVAVEAALGARPRPAGSGAVVRPPLSIRPSVRPSPAGPYVRAAPALMAPAAGLAGGGEGRCSRGPARSFLPGRSRRRPRLRLPPLHT